MTKPKTLPVLDLSPEIEFLWDKLNTAIQGVLCSTQFIMGPNVKAFEQEVADYLGVKHAIGVNSGTDALVIALKAAGIGSGDEVLTTSFSFFATAEAICQVGATPIFVDIDPDTFNMDPVLAAEHVTASTRAILPVHLYGQAAECDALRQLAERYGLRIIEDVAQAFGGEYYGKKLGTLGDVGAYSFFPSKNLGAYGDGGLIATNNDEIAENSRMLRAHGAKKKYYNEVVGYNSRLDEMQAAILRVKLPYIDQWIDGRRQVAQRYIEGLGHLKSLRLPEQRPHAKHSFHQFTIALRDGKRDAVQQALTERGIGTMIYYPVPIHKLPVYKDQPIDLPVSEAAAESVLSLPIWPQMSADDQGRVIEALNEICSP
jgi:dTDP-4-amino-4,6-dideoxygalactose transaminase